MNVRRVVVGGNPRAPRLPIPPMCLDSKTLFLSELDVLFLYKDTRQAASDYVQTLLPHLSPQIHRDALIKAYWTMPDNGWLEFNYETKLLSYCSLEK